MELSVEDIANELVANSEDMALIHSEVIKKTAELQSRLKDLQALDANLRVALKDAMEANKVKKFDNDYVTFTYIAPTVRRGLDMTKLRTDHPDIVEQYQTESPVKASVRIKIKENK